ncbi:MAG TPA: HNH endonuclease signature motif containing protein [Azospirillaceae bacterium]|nr:HNH endonuclease signature motif containing protein [Azospirillaceae bacterium]
MSDDNYSPIKRWAIWHCYDKKCAACGDPILIDDMEIDHIIPKAAVRSNRWDEIKRVFSVDEDFIRSFRNLRPLCGIHNGLKSETILPFEILASILEIAKRKEVEIRDAYEKKNEQVLQSGWRTIVLTALKRGRLKNIDFVHGELVGEVFNSGVSKVLISERVNIARFLGDQRCSLAGEPILRLGYEVVMVNDEGAEELVASPKRFEEYLKGDFEVRNVESDPAQLAKAVLLSAVNGLSYWLPRFRISETSKISDAGVSIFDLSAVPAYVLGLLDIDGYQPDQDETVQDLINANIVEISSLSTDMLSLKAGGEDFDITEVIRGDFDNDGDEEILIQISRDDLYSHTDFRVVKYDHENKYFYPLDDELD